MLLPWQAVKIAKAMGCEVTVLSTSESKRAEATAMGADHFDVSRDAALMKACFASFSPGYGVR